MSAVCVAYYRSRGFVADKAAFPLFCVGVKLHAADKTRNNKLVLFNCTNDVLHEVIAPYTAIALQ